MRHLIRCFFSVVLCFFSFQAWSQSNELQLLPANEWDSNETHQVVWDTTPGVRYDLQESGSLTNWTSVAGYPAAASQYANAYVFNA
jgi:hypothetical protein